MIHHIAFVGCDWSDGIELKALKGVLRPLQKVALILHVDAAGRGQHPVFRTARPRCMLLWQWN